jgi:hypothetical protein
MNGNGMRPEAEVRGMREILRKQLAGIEEQLKALLANQPSPASPRLSYREYDAAQDGLAVALERLRADRRWCLSQLQLIDWVLGDTNL